jgi:hypothetical protein
VKDYVPLDNQSGVSVTEPADFSALVILLVEDNADLRGMAADYLRDVCFEVVATGKCQGRRRRIRSR